MEDLARQVERQASVTPYLRQEAEGKRELASWRLWASLTALCMCLDGRMETEILGWGRCYNGARGVTWVPATESGNQSLRNMNFTF